MLLKVKRFIAMMVAIAMPKVIIFTVAIVE